MEILFENIYLEIVIKSWIVLVGCNGVGKLIFLKIIVGIDVFDSGIIVKNKIVMLGYLV